ncbi:hypothetical protein [Dysgonomonas gadei]|uniref:Uncharacterized protein n=2 Tax=Dysgonomonas gadei TaxID=156974 RepID=F5IU85_9BACT|nr:hypothetical protein [Dysgonomonas gadei]EGK03264.1 hypothetical protein HMPREF9455_00652 [Dysgonomonas gadei ATCC BAA-286]
MKKSILAITFILICSGLAAQPPMGGGGGGRPQGGPGGGRPPMMNKQGQNQDSFMIMGIPEIPDLTLEQREKLGKEITNERKDISKLMQEKQELKIDSENPGMAEKDRQKLFGKMAKIDEKIKKKEEKYDKKYRSILSDEQYNIFSANKKNIEFRGQGIPNRGNRQQPPAQRPDDNGGRPDMADDDMF